MSQEALEITGFHAHVYYGKATQEAAERVREQLGKQFTVELGRWHDKPVGPHPQPMYQVKFAPDQFAPLVSWLMLHHGGLNILVHPVVSDGDDVADHTERAIWLGEKFALNLDVLRPKEECQEHKEHAA